MPLHFLRSPTAWQALGQARGRVEFVETRHSWVFLCGSRVLKLKKPVRERMLDWSTPALRARACREEVRVNQRFAPGVYLGVVALCGSPGAWRLDPAPARDLAEDWLVLMRRLPAKRSMDRLIARGAIARRDLELLARHLVDCWGRAPQPAASPAQVSRRFADELRLSVEALESHRLTVPGASTTPGRCAAALQTAAGLIAERVATGRYVEGHGDLRPEHVWLPAGRQAARPRVIDALELDPALRIVDPWDELAFLMLECRRLGAARAGLRLLAQCARLMGERPPRRLLAAYTAHRALLRARLALAHLEETPVRKPGQWRPLASWYLGCAEAAASRLRALTAPSTLGG